MLQQGSIIRAKVYDPQGRNPKIRPLVVVAPTHEISNAHPIAVVAITGEFGNPLEADAVMLPWHRHGKANSGLTKPCVAKCSWQEAINLADVVEKKGFLRAEHVAAILEKIAELDSH